MMRRASSFFGLGLTLVACSGNGSTIPESSDGGINPDGNMTSDDAAEMPLDDSGIPLPINPAPAEGLSISEIAAFQTLKIPLAKSGNPVSSTVALVAGKEALLRVYVKLDASWTTHNVVAILDITAGGNTKTMKDVLAPAVDSKDETILSTFNFHLTPDLVTTDATYAVRVVEAMKTAQPTTDPLPTRFPMDGMSQAALGAQSVGSQLKIVLVPMRYTYDGSNRMPDTSQAQLDIYKNIFYAMYPAPQVNITVRSPINAPTYISPTGSGWGSALQALSTTRQSDGASADSYYYGVFEPAPTFAQFCGGGCIAGLSSLAQSPSDSWARVGVGLGYGGGQDGYASAYTAAHEVGHQHGRNHAPCGGAQGIDPGYPYPQGNTNSIGYALVDIGWAPQGSVIPTQAGNYPVKDIMGYCDPKWISDYNYKALFTRMKIVNGAAMVPGPTMFYRWAQMDGSGNVSNIGPRISGTLPPFGKETTVGGKKAWFYPYDHLPGGQVLIAD